MARCCTVMGVPNSSRGVRTRGEQYSNVIELAVEGCVVDLCFKLLLLSHLPDVGRASAESSSLHTASGAGNVQGHVDYPAGKSHKLQAWDPGIGPILPQTRDWSASKTIGSRGKFGIPLLPISSGTEIIENSDLRDDHGSFEYGT